MVVDYYLYAALALAAVLSAVLGGNNFSTCLGASLGAGIIKLSDAMLIASAGMLLGVMLEGYKLSEVLAGRVLQTLSASGVLVILVSGVLVMAVVTLLRLPLSLSQVIVGAGWGVALATGVQIGMTYSILVILSWVLSPAFGFIVSAIIESTILRLGRRAKDVLALNRLYASLTLVAGFYAAYTLGANTIGLLVGMFPSSVGDSLHLSLSFGVAAILGTLFLSKGTVRSVADNLVGLNPSTALSAQFGGAVSVHLFTQFGLPVSVSQVVIGGMSGAASVKRMVITNRRIVQQVIAGWTVGPMAGAILSFLLARIV